MKAKRTIIKLILLVIMLAKAYPIEAAPIRTVDETSIKTIGEAQRAVDHAWDVYHIAALSGTLSSPQVQTQIESDLHTARTQLVEAKDAAKMKNQKRLTEKLAQIDQITQRVVQQSQEKKQ